MGGLIWTLRVCLILFALFCFLTAPNLFHRKLSHKQLTGHDYAHRGLYDNKRGIPENSLAAFERAIRAGYGIELDVRETRDHVLVVHHDETLERSCGDPRRVCDVPLAELKRDMLDHPGRYAVWFFTALGIAEAGRKSSRPEREDRP